jgi:hypothetical protein
MKITRISMLGAVSLLAGCATPTLFRSNFDTSDVGAAPTGAQFRGTLALVGPAGSAQVINPPDGSSGNWLQAGSGQAPSGIIGRFTAQPAPGVFHFASVLDLPAGAGTGAITFNAAQSAGQASPPAFLTLQFLPNDRVQINNDPATTFGGFARNTPFQVLVTLDTAAARPTAHIVLAGAGASGSADTTIADATLAQRFDSVAVLAAANTPTTIAATNIAVTGPTKLAGQADQPVAVTMRD